MNELKYYGLNACLAIWKKRPKDIIRVYLDPVHLKTVKPLLKWCAQNKKAYHLVKSDELNKISESVHHEGLCVFAKKPTYPREVEPKDGCVLYLDGVHNPHNLGAILRSSAHFDVQAVIGDQPVLSPSCCRVAMGGAELVPWITPARPLAWLKKHGYALIATTSAHEGDPLFNFSFPPRAALILGSETNGISKQLLSKADCLVRIPGSGSVESLNVSVAAALCMSEYYRQHRQ